MARWPVGERAGREMKFEATWTAPSEGSRVGTFKLLRDSRPVMYEFQLIEQQSDGVWPRLRRYGPGMVDRDERPARLKLAAADPSRLILTNSDGDAPSSITYDRTGGNGPTNGNGAMTRQGKPVSQTLRFARPPGKSATSDASGRIRNAYGGG
jgi:hypothetical protein